MTEQEVTTEGVDVFEAFALDLTAEKEGRWFRNVRPGLDLLIGRTNGPEYQRLFERKMREAQALVDAGELDSETTEQIMVECIAEKVLLGWGGTKGMAFQGEKLAYSPATSLKVLSPPAMRDFRNLVWNLGSNAENYRQRTLRDDAKN